MEKLSYRILFCVAALLCSTLHGASALELSTPDSVVMSDIESGNNLGVKKKFDRGIQNKVFMPKGTIFAGGTISYTMFDSNDYTFLLFDNLNATSRLINGSLMGGYTFSDNIAVGLAFDYSRTLVEIENVDMSLSEDLNFSVSDYYSIQQVFSGSAFLRTYINIGNSKRFGLYNDLKVYFAGGQGKVTNGATGQALVGTYEKINKIGLVLQPGISVFATDFMTIEASIGIFGIEYKRVEQISNQVYQGTTEFFNASFQLNLLKINMGLAFYF